MYCIPTNIIVLTTGPVFLRYDDAKNNRKKQRYYKSLCTLYNLMLYTIMAAVLLNFVIGNEEFLVLFYPLKH